MTLTMSCPECSASCEPEELAKWSQLHIVPLHCTNCDTVFWVPVSLENQIIKEEHKLPATVPPLPIDLEITIDNREHGLHGKIGHIVGKKYGHYVVAIDGRNITVPEHWVKKNCG